MKRYIISINAAILVESGRYYEGYILLVGAWTNSNRGTVDSVQSQANIQRKFDSVSQNLFDFENVASKLKLCHEICHAHARELERAGHTHLRIHFAVWTLHTHIDLDRANLNTIWIQSGDKFECSVYSRALDWSSL